MADPILNATQYNAVADWWANKVSGGTAIRSENAIASLWWQYRQGGDGIVEDAAELNQAVTIILGTAQGSDIHRPDFSSGIWDVIDYPINRAIPYAVRESVNAIELWEPRLELTGLQVSGDEPAGKLQIDASWKVIDSDTGGEVAIAFG